MQLVETLICRRRRIVRLDRRGRQQRTRVLLRPIAEKFRRHPRTLSRWKASPFKGGRSDQRGSKQQDLSVCFFAGLRSRFLRRTRVLGPQRSSFGAVLPTHLLSRPLVVASTGQSRRRIRFAFRRRRLRQLSKATLEPPREPKFFLRGQGDRRVELPLRGRLHVFPHHLDIAGVTSGQE